MSDSNPPSPPAEQPYGLPLEPRECDSWFTRQKAWLRRRCGPAVPATSIVGEAVVRGYQRLLQGLEVPFRMLHQILINLVIDRVRREKVAQRTREDLARASGGSAVLDAEQARATEERRQETERAVAAAVASLPAAYREVWECRQQGMTNQQIAETQGKDVEAVRQTYSRCLKRLREALRARPKG